MCSETFIQVVVPLRLNWTPWYRCPSPVARGTRVSVVFARRQYVGVVWKSGTPEGIDISKIQKVQQTETGLRPVSEEELRFWEFLSSYYLCSMGEVYKAAYPAIKTRSEQTAANILERLRSRLAIREEALAKKHKDSVRERLEKERDSIASQIESLTRIPEGAPPQAGPGKPVLITGSGRTQEYIKRTADALSKGFNVLVISPEIAAGEHLEAIFEDSFPGQVHRINSSITPVRRRHIAEDVNRFGGQVVVGTRSALFLPFSRLGLVIVDNEQDVLLKQTEPAPRYNARDAAVVLAGIHGAQAVLGSPAPSLESYRNAVTGKYGYLKTGENSTPVTIIDTSGERRKNGMVGPLSRKLLEEISKTPGDVALIRGWEKPDELAGLVEQLLPGRRADILTLQQARTGGLDAYSLVAVLQADAFLGDASNFRSDEHALQALAVLRESCKGVFIIQTAKPAHPVFSEPDDVYRLLAEERKAFALPPFTRLVDTECEGRRERITLKADSTLATRKQQILERALEAERLSSGRIRTMIDVDPV